MNIKETIHNISSGIWLSIVTCFMFFLYAPLELLFTNPDEFWFDAYILVSIMLVVFLIAAICSIIFFYVVRMWGYQKFRVILLLYFIAFICSYIQGNWLAGGLPALDGHSIDWRLYTAERTKSIVLWVIVTAVAVVIFCKVKKEYFEKIVKVVSICMILMFGVTLLTLGLENHGFVKKPSLVLTSENMFEMSEDKNFIILVLDAADAMQMEDLFETDGEYGEIFRDFTFYDNMVGAYPFTKHSVPYILTGQWFENETRFSIYETEAYRTSPLLANLEEAGYKMAVYTPEILLEDTGKERFDNIVPGERGVSDKWAFARWQMLMTVFKYAPYDIKRLFFVNPNAFRELIILPDDTSLFTTSNKTFYEDLLEEELNCIDQKCFKFIHIDGAHVPYLYDKDVNEIGDATYETSLQACMTITKAYLDKLKEGDVYDNSVIIVMADHGYNDNMHNKKGEIRQNPIFFVKGIHESHEFRISHAPVSFEDLQTAYQRLLSGMESDEIFDWKEGDSRDRRFLVYEYKKEDPIIEYIQPGEAWDTDIMYETGNVYTRD